jgi:hypothetical protein
VFESESGEQGALEVSYASGNVNTYYGGGDSRADRSFAGFVDTSARPRLDVQRTYSHTQSFTTPSLAENDRYALSGDSVVVSRSSSASTIRAVNGASSVTIDRLAGTIRYGSMLVARCTCSQPEPVFLATDNGALPAAVEAQFQAFWTALENAFGLGAWPQYTNEGLSSP